MDKVMKVAAVLGAGAWGTAIALSLHRRGGHFVTLWSHSETEAQQIADAGDLDHEIDIHRTDEIGILKRAVAMIQPIDMLGYLFWYRVAHKIVYYVVAASRLGGPEIGRAHV